MLCHLDPPCSKGTDIEVVVQRRMPNAAVDAAVRKARGKTSHRPRGGAGTCKCVPCNPTQQRLTRCLVCCGLAAAQDASHVAVSVYTAANLLGLGNGGPQERVLSDGFQPYVLVKWADDTSDESKAAPIADWTRVPTRGLIALDWQGARLLLPLNAGPQALYAARLCVADLAVVGAQPCVLTLLVLCAGLRDARSLRHLRIQVRNGASSGGTHDAAQPGQVLAACDIKVNLPTMDSRKATSGSVVPHMVSLSTIAPGTDAPARKPTMQLTKHGLAAVEEDLASRQARVRHARSRVGVGLVLTCSRGCTRGCNAAVAGRGCEGWRHHDRHGACARKSRCCSPSCGGITQPRSHVLSVRQASLAHGRTSRGCLTVYACGLPAHVHVGLCVSTPHQGVLQMAKTVVAEARFTRNYYAGPLQELIDRTVARGTSVEVVMARELYKGLCIDLRSFMANSVVRIYSPPPLRRCSHPY